MKNLAAVLVLSALSFAQNKVPRLDAENAIRIAEFYRLAPLVEDKVWPRWSEIPAPLILVTAETEFLAHHPQPPKEFIPVADDLYARPRHFPINLQATFPAFGPPAIMAVGEPANTQSKTSTPWVIMLMHEHFHQLQWAQPGYMDAVNDIGLSKNDTTGMWMLNYPFPYDNPAVARGFADLRDLLLRAINEPDGSTFRSLAKEYVDARKRFLAQLSSDDHKYFAFQLWQEGIARYTEVRCAEAAADYRPSSSFARLSDYESFRHFAKGKRPATLDELKVADLPTGKRNVVYSFGASEGFLLDRLNPKWREGYFTHMLSTDSFFAGLK